LNHNQTFVAVIASLGELNDVLLSILRNPLEHAVANTEAQASVLGHVHVAFVNQRQHPIAPNTSAERGALVALRAAAKRSAVSHATFVGDHQRA
jgi:hypothetical protein